jgi:signal transduction histidine kinase
MGLYNAATIEIKDPKSLEYLEYINKTAQRMDQVLKALINLSDIKDRALSLELTNLREIVADIMQILENKNLINDIEFKINIPDVSINTDAGLVMVIIKNLLENAIRYSRLTIKSLIELDIAVLNDDSIQISITDNGLGIPNQIQDKVFNMFFKGNNLSSGSGLGLYMVKTAACKLGGKVTLNSTINSGTTMQITLPALKS